MNYLVNKAQMRQYDRNTTEYYGIPPMVLMERAALSVVTLILSGNIGQYVQGIHDKEWAPQRFLILCGTGNNGADGLAVARLLREQKKEASVLLCGDPAKRSECNKQQLQICKQYGVLFTDNPDDSEYDMVIDALFGIGLNREPDAAVCALIERINRMQIPVLAVDVPSGVDVDQGRILGSALRADVTATFGFEKIGMYRYPARSMCGHIVCCPIGITGESFLGEEPEAGLITENDVRAWWRKRPADGNKGTFGKVLLMAGQKNMAGACILAAKSCYRMGAGMVRILTCEENREILQQTVPEALLTVFGQEPEQEIIQKIREAVSWADVIAAGPGIGTDLSAAEHLQILIEASKEKTLILDADALNLLSRIPELRQAVRDRKPMTTILTPHMGELSRLTGKTIPEIRDQFPKVERTLTEELHCILAAKDAVTFLYAPDQRISVCASGNDGMATAGSGDVLTGMIAALAADGMEPYQAAAAAVYMHGMSGTLAAEALTKESVMAGDLILWIPDMIRQIRQGNRQNRNTYDSKEPK